MSGALTVVHHDLAEINPASTTRTQRWTNRQHSWVRRSDGGFDAAQYTVEPIREAVAKAFVLDHHYAGTYPVAKHRYGLFSVTPDGPRLDGVAVFGIPAQAAVLTNVFPDMEPYVESLELCRFVLDGSAPANAESWFLARSYEHLAAAGGRGIVSFADPVPRRVGEQVLFPGHVGFIYQASNAVFTGRGTARTLTVLPDGTSLSDRAIQKVRRGEQGHEYVERRLISLGARPPRAGELGALWLRDALEVAGAVRLRHRGNLRYAMVTSRRHRSHLRTLTPSLPYVKQPDAA